MKKFLILTLFWLTLIKPASANFVDTVETKSISYRQDTVLSSFITEWLGVPYKFAGKTKRGIDCSQFSKRLYKDVYAKALPDVCWKQWKATKRVSRNNLQIGDLIFFKSKRSPSGWHVGVYLGNNKFVHAPSKRSYVKVSNLEEKYYRNTYRGAGRL